jgi:hypothetical protein
MASIRVSIARLHRVAALVPSFGTTSADSSQVTKQFVLQKFYSDVFLQWGYYGAALIAIGVGTTTVHADDKKANVYEQEWAKSMSCL